MEEMKTVRSRIKRQSRKARILFTVAFWTGVLSFVVMLVPCLGMLGCPESDFSITMSEVPAGTVGTGVFSGLDGSVRFPEELRTLSFDMNELGLSAEDSPKTAFLLVYSRLFPFLAAYVGITWLLRRIFRNAEKEETPFLRSGSRAVCGIGVWIAFAVFMDAAAYPLSVYLLGIGTEETLSSVNILAGFALAVPFFCLAKIFDYGAALQQESDETL